jgi:hypothetical protein
LKISFQEVEQAVSHVVACQKPTTLSALKDPSPSTLLSVKPGGRRKTRNLKLTTTMTLSLTSPNGGSAAVVSLKRVNYCKIGGKGSKLRLKGSKK